MSALVEGRYDLVPIPDAKLAPRKFLYANKRSCRSSSIARHRGGRRASLVENQ
jgi:hypothetical protein